ncbi:hypothetical protein [Pragia fontium]|uniref:hypothetical protein n=1 Tax=Pragia fontium TaxID=82985 RepID=UPI0011873C63|nr:hypothetical protein [Pragia fontium]
MDNKLKVDNPVEDIKAHNKLSKLIVETLKEYMTVHYEFLTEEQRIKLMCRFTTTDSDAEYPIPFEYYGLLMEKDISPAMYNEIHSIINTGENISWSWLLEMVDFHSNVLIH